MGRQRSRGKARARVLTTNRKQLKLRAAELESLLPQGHSARLVWGFVERCDSSALFTGTKAYEGGAGRNAIPPETLLAL